MGDWFWVPDDLVSAIHSEELREHGGEDGLRNAGLLQSVLARPRDLAKYGNPDAAELAASYAFGIANDHPFVDGNERTAYFVCAVFLEQNGVAMTANVDDFLAFVAGGLSEEGVKYWIRDNSTAD